MRSMYLGIMLSVIAAGGLAQEGTGEAPAGEAAAVPADAGQALIRRDALELAEAVRRLVSLSQRRMPSRLSDSEERAWQEQSRRLIRHAATLQDIVDDMNDYLDGDPDAEERAGIRARARSVIHRLQSRAEAYNNAEGFAAETRQQMARDALAGIELR